jgi:hypothetical protein
MSRSTCDRALSAARLAGQLANELSAIAQQAAMEQPDAVNPCEGPALRPHTIPGWWQVWSGYMCIALLRPEDVAPLLAATAS